VTVPADRALDRRIDWSTLKTRNAPSATPITAGIVAPAVLYPSWISRRVTSIPIGTGKAASR
jgi:hypothetical protein